MSKDLQKETYQWRREYEMSRLRSTDPQGLEIADREVESLWWLNKVKGKGHDVKSLTKLRLFVPLTS